jgi:hypothetical protein
MVVLSGFHSPIERDCLDTVLRGSNPIIICPARRLCHSRLPREWQKAIEAGRMLLLSPFNEILIAYAHPGSKTEALCHEVLTTGKRVYTFNDPANRHLIEMGAVPIEPDHFSRSAVVA